MKNPFRKKPFNPQEELDKIREQLDNAWRKYKRNPNRINTMYLEGLIDIVERLVQNFEAQPK